jgi:hypothetical protein
MKKKKKKLNSGLLLAGITILILALIIGALFFVSQNFAQESILDYEIDEELEELKTNKNEDGSFTIKYLIEDGSSEEHFTIKKERIEYIFEHDIKNQSPFFDCSVRKFNKIIYIVLDVSGSVIDKYSVDNAVEKIHTILGENAQPGDQIRIRFIGSNNYDDKEYNIDFTGPKFNNYQLYENKRLNKNIIILKNYSEEEMPNCNRTIVAPTIKNAVEKIESIYKERIKNKDEYTNIINTLKSISNEVKIEYEKEKPARFESVLYVIFTDGRQTKGGYAACDTEPANSCGDGLKELKMSDNDEAIVIGIKSSEIKEIFTKFFDNIKINFK